MKTMQMNAPYLKRFTAFLTDLLLLDLIILSPLGNLVFRKIPLDSPRKLMDYMQSNPGNMQFLNAVGIVVVIVALLYFVLFEYILDQTIGMMLFRLRIEHIEGKNRLWECIVRNLFLVPFPFFTILFVAEIVYLFYSPQGQRLTEHLTASKVVIDIPVTTFK